MKVILHKSIIPGSYLVEGTTLKLVRNGPGSWMIGISMMGGDVNWQMRNQDLFAASFSTLREAREALEAAFSLDPPKVSRLRLLKRIGPGHYRFEEEGEELDVLRTVAGIWKVYFPGQRLWRVYHNLGCVKQDLYSYFELKA